MDNSAQITQRLTELRKVLFNLKLDGFIATSADEYQNEYTPECARRLEYISGFTGSLGMAAILADMACIFVDGRYTIQARKEAPPSLYQYANNTEKDLIEWLRANPSSGSVLGYDPWLHSGAWVERMSAALKRFGIALRPCQANPIDSVWKNRPAEPLGKAFTYDLKYAGQSHIDKISMLSKQIAEDGLDAAVLTRPDSIAWLLNIRGNDIPFTPLVLCFAILNKDGSVELFVNLHKIPSEVSAYLLKANLNVLPTEALATHLDALGKSGKRVLVDMQSTPAWVSDRLTQSGAHIEKGMDPCLMPKACKNKTELEGMRNAHIRDGVAVVKLLHWIDKILAEYDIGELDISYKAEEFRKEQDLFKGLSFPTIAGVGPNGAIVHYQPKPETNRTIKRGDLVLVDSGGQYLDGTTDITRTIATGQLKKEMCDRFTCVLKGHIALATVRFPEGTTGSQIDVLARKSLWDAGLDFEHGTGHGVGCYLGVHEGPQRISKVANNTPLKPGMIVSNEPGYYKEGNFGIRIESLMAVRKCDDMKKAEQPMLCFEMLTMAPIDTKLVDVRMLTHQERDWLNSYHREVFRKLKPYLPLETAKWLKQKTAKL